MGQRRADRVYLRIDPELKEAMRDYCARRHTTLSELVSRFFVKLLERELSDNKVDAEQI
jgi:hypothetical protein